MNKKQKTIQQKITFSGIGVHSGAPSRVTIWPADEGSGIVFCDAVKPEHKIVIGKVIPEAAMHATVIKGGDSWYVSTIEHLVAALSVLGVNNAIVEVAGNEIPILDGSAMIFVQAILDVGFVVQAGDCRVLTPRNELSFVDQNGRAIHIIPALADVSDTLDVEYSADFSHPLAGSPRLQAVITPDFFIDYIAPARTYGFLEQLPFLRQHNLARGSSLSNTVVIGQEMMNDKRFPDECVRHKVLDLIGDLSLLGAPLAGTIKAHKTSHNFNRLVIQHFVQNPDQWTFIEKKRA